MIKTLTEEPFLLKFKQLENLEKELEQFLEQI